MNGSDDLGTLPPWMQRNGTSRHFLLGGETSRAGGMVDLADTDRVGRHRSVPRNLDAPIRRRRTRRAAVIAVTSALALVVSTFVVLGAERARQAIHPSQPGSTALPTTPASYLGVAATGVPDSYAGVTAFTDSTGVRPGLVVYYSGWLEPFQTNFAATVAQHGAVPIVQIDPTNVSLAAIATGQYDAYLISYAKAVRAYRKPVILSFGHEMNGPWSSWGYGHTSPVTFVAAWRHIVDIFRSHGAWNVTWMWTVNIIKTASGHIPNPAPWWPGRSYVNWVGVDAYYLHTSWEFVSTFGPTIIAVRELTSDPILIAETSAKPAAAQPEKIADLFAGVRAYGLLGFVWFNVWPVYRISGPRAIAALRQGAKTYGLPDADRGGSSS
jgi:mannan endo-1,4-beta-mannosidase